MALSYEKRKRIIEQLNNNFSIRAIAKNEKVDKNTVLSISKKLKEEKADIDSTVEILVNTSKHIEVIKSKYNPDDFRRLFNKSVSLSSKYADIDMVVGNGIKPLVEANFIGANIYSNEILANIKEGTISADQIASMIQINNEAVKISERAKETLREGVMKEEMTEAQTTIDYDSLDTVSATNEYLKSMNG